MCLKYFYSQYFCDWSTRFAFKFKLKKKKCSSCWEHFYVPIPIWHVHCVIQPDRTGRNRLEGANYSDNNSQIIKQYSQREYMHTVKFLLQPLFLYFWHFILKEHWSLFKGSVADISIPNNMDNISPFTVQLNLELLAKICIESASKC